MEPPFSGKSGDRKALGGNCRGAVGRRALLGYWRWSGVRRRQVSVLGLGDKTAICKTSPEQGDCHLGSGRGRQRTIQYKGPESGASDGNSTQKGKNPGE